MINAGDDGAPVPHELKTKEDFQRLLESAKEVRVVKRGENAKAKLRTSGGLYTFKTTAEEADELLKGTKVPIVEL